MADTANPRPSITEPPIFEVLRKSGRLLYALPGKRGSGVWALQGRGAWHVSWDARRYTWVIQDQNTMPD